MEEFAKAFADADSVAVLAIYAASEEPIEEISGERLAERIATVHQGTQYCGSFADAVEWTVGRCRAGDAVITLGAGNVALVGEMVLDELRRF